MQQLRDSLSDNDLEALLYHKYSPHDMIVIFKDKPKTAFVEDFLLDKSSIKKVSKKRKIIHVYPSTAYDKQYADFKENGVATAEAAAAVYFKLYKKLFGEEDQTWNGCKLAPAVTMIRAFGHANGDNYEDIIRFLRKLLPLWKEQLTKGVDFPSSRPTLETLFGKSRHFWSNRNLYYKKWNTTQAQ